MSDSTTVRRVTKLSASAVKAYVPRLCEGLSDPDRRRLKRAVDLLADKNELRLNQVLDALFEGKSIVEQLTAFRQLRARLTGAAEGCGAPVRLTVDTRKRSVPANRRCWFVRVDALKEKISAENRRLIEAPKYVPALAVRGRLDSLDTQTGETDSRKRVVVIDLLNAWLNGADRPRYAALLGELGVGKTTTCRFWAAYLSERRAKDLHSPLPIYFDLRAIAEQAPTRVLDATLPAYLQILIDARPQGLSPQDVVRYVRHEGALVIFDGLDEVLVHMMPAQGRAFVRQLLSILPPEEASGAGQSRTTSRPGRVLVTCRTHYFRTLRDQDVFLFAEQYRSTSARSFDAFLLIPFDEAQVREYLGRTFEPALAEHYLEFIKQVHNLSELAVRPLLLAMISEQLQLLEEQRLRGETINGAKLYGNFVKSWLDRDETKHRILPEHKQMLMEELAADLSRDGCGGRRVDTVEQWLVERLNGESAIAAHYPNSPIELLKEDLRTATFIVRDGEDEFHFAHKSLQEFFLACYLKRGLIEWDFARWQSLQRSSNETLVFLGQLLRIAPPDQCDRALAAFRYLRDTYIGDANLLAFRYGLIAHENGLPVPSLAGFQLQRLDLRGLKICGKRLPLNLDRACFSQAQLDGAIFDCVSLEDAEFTDASLERTQFHGCRLVAAAFARATLIGTVFRHCNASDAQFAGAQCHRTQWLYCHLPQVHELPFAAPSAFFAQCTPDVAIDVDRSAGSFECDLFDGHIAEIKSAVFSPDGRYVLSGAVDACLKLWDAATGECLNTMRGHTGAINAVAFLAGGQRLVSASADGTLRLWDTANGRCLTTLVGHHGAVTAVACAPHGKYLLSSSNDGSIRLWNAGDGTCEMILNEHTAAVTTIACSADETQFLSGAADRTVRLWDLATGRCLKTMQTAKEPIGVAFSPHKRARRVLLSLSDGTLQILDAISGDAVHELSAAVGQPVLSAVFSPEGNIVLSGRKSGELALWDAVTCEQTRTEELMDRVNAVAFSSDGRRFLAAGGNRIEIYSVDAEGPVRTLSAHYSRIDAIAVTPDGRSFRCDTEDEGSLSLDLHDAVGVAGERKRAVPEHRGNKELISVLQHFLLWYSHTGIPVALWDLDLGDPVHSLEASQALDTSDHKRSANVDRNLESLTIDGDGNCITCIAYSPARRSVLLGQRNGSIDVWKLDALERSIELKHCTAAIASVAVSPDGALAVSLGRDGIATLWDLERGTYTHTLRTTVDEVTTARFLPNGRQIMVAGTAEVAFWELGATPTEVLRVRSFGKGAFAWWQPGKPNSLQWTGEAWRWLGVLARTQHSGTLERYPVEAFIAGDVMQPPVPPRSAPTDILNLSLENVDEPEPSY